VTAADVIVHPSDIKIQTSSKSSSRGCQPRGTPKKPRHTKTPLHKPVHQIIENWDDLDFTSTSSESEEETQSRSSRSLRKTRSRGRSKEDDFAFDNHGFASENDKNKDRKIHKSSRK
jgi:hypothetical protein